MTTMADGAGNEDQQKTVLRCAGVWKAMLKRDVCVCGHGERAGGPAVRGRARTASAMAEHALGRERTTTTMHRNKQSSGGGGRGAHWEAVGVVVRAQHSAWTEDEEVDDGYVLPSASKIS